MRPRLWIPLLLFAAFAYLSLAYVPRQVIFAERSPITLSPQAVGLAFEEVVISPADSTLQLAAWWMPAEEASAALVFVHGGGSNRQTAYFKALEFYREMVAQGVSVLAVDLRNHGNSDADDRGLQFGLSESADAIAAIEWVGGKAAQLPVFAMGISMGGATLIHAVHRGASVQGLILLDPLLDTRSAFTRGAAAATGLPPALFGPAAWAATEFYGLPEGDNAALNLALELTLPILLMQDPDDPVTVAQYAHTLAEGNNNVTLWMAPPVDTRHPDLAWKAGWGSHVAAFHMFPEQAVDAIVQFMENATAAP